MLTYEILCFLLRADETHFWEYNARSKRWYYFATLEDGRTEEWWMIDDEWLEQCDAQTIELLVQGAIMTGL